VANHFSGQAPLIEHHNTFAGPFDGLCDFHRFGFTPSRIVYKDSALSAHEPPGMFRSPPVAE
jgi:hypothetical protein